MAKYVLYNLTHNARLRSSLLDKSKDFAQHLSPALLNNLLALGCAILIKKTVNLNKLKNYLGLLLGNRQTKTDSHYRRQTRFFINKTALNKSWKWLITSVLDYTKRWDGRSRSSYLTLDGTSWQLGTKQIHFLVLWLVYRGVSLPLVEISEGLTSGPPPRLISKKADRLFRLEMTRLSD